MALVDRVRKTLGACAWGRLASAADPSQGGEVHGSDKASTPRVGGWRDRRREAKAAKNRRKAEKRVAAREAEAGMSKISSRTYQEMR